MFVSDDMDAMRAAAAAAMAVGYERTAVLEGGVQALTQSAMQQVGFYDLCAAMATQADTSNSDVLVLQKQLTG